MGILLFSTAKKNGCPMGEAAIIICLKEILQFSYFNIPEPNIIAMILKTDIPC
jgi:hypothetical protein